MHYNVNKPAQANIGKSKIVIPRALSISAVIDMPFLVPLVIAIIEKTNAGETKKKATYVKYIAQNNAKATMLNTNPTIPRTSPAIAIPFERDGYSAARG